MLDIQLGWRNPPLAVMDKFKKKIQEQAKEKMSEGGGDKKSYNYKNRVSPNGKSVLIQKFIQTKKLLKWQVLEQEPLRFSHIFGSDPMVCL